MKKILFLILFLSLSTNAYSFRSTIKIDNEKIKREQAEKIVTLNAQNNILLKDINKSIKELNQLLTKNVEEQQKLIKYLIAKERINQ